MQTKRLLLLLIFTAAALFGGEPVRADTYNWLGNTSNWSDGNQWSGGANPRANSSDTVLAFGNPASGTSYTSSDDSAENTTAFTLNGLIFNGTTGTAIIAGASHSLTFVNSSSAVSPSNGSFSGINVASGLVLNDCRNAGKPRFSGLEFGL